jgi:hypothetical protein
MTDLVEKVARAIAKSNGLTDAEINARWKAYELNAKAAVALVIEEAALHIESFAIEPGLGDKIRSLSPEHRGKDAP